MSAPTDANKPTTPVTTAPGPESPTTARPLEMDDDDVQEPGVLETSGAGAASTTAAARAGEDAPPAKPPRPMTEQQKNQMMLKEAFPTLDEAVIKAVLTASGGRIDPAFNALLEMTDPDAANREVEDESPPAPPPRPVTVPGATPQSQLEADELYARQLAQHYENVGAYEERTSSRAPRQQTGLDPNRALGGTRGRGQHQQEPERSFVDDDLPIIKENLRKGFEETQKTVNTWFQTMKKRFDEEFVDDQPQHQQGRPGQQGGPSRGGRVGGDAGRRSGDYERYDADPQVLSDDFAGMKFHNDGTPVSARNSPNPNIFRPPPPSKSPRPGEDRKVSFRDEADEIGDVYNVSPNPTGTAGGSGGGAAAKSSKWQPLSAVDPNPIAENDPFSLGDSDDEKDAAATASKGPAAAAAAAKPTSPAGEIKMEDAERLRKAAAEAMNESLVDGKAGADGAKKT